MAIIHGEEKKTYQCPVCESEFSVRVQRYEGWSGTPFVTIEAPEGTYKDLDPITSESW